MPIDRSQFQIQVVTTADTAALEKTIATLNEVKKTEAALGHDTSQIEQILDVKNAELDKAKAAEEAGKKQVKAAEDTTLSHRELREAVSAVGRQFGGLADVGLWLNPTTAALAALLAAVEGVKKVFEQLQAPVDAFNAEMLALDDSKLKSAAESASGMSESLSDIVNTEKKLQAAYESGTTAMDHRIKKYGEEQDAILKVEEAREKAFEAEIDLLAKSGAISKEEADRRKEQAQLQLDSDRGAIDQKKLRFEIDLR
ncbi:MAG TPA: hypothetical protein VFC44_10515, partial [Candidatus Saccharimonadales bacterium]|nr:hypothetical protein [Candidatus Saccharimonadales bacterium]